MATCKKTQLSSLLGAAAKLKVNLRFVVGSSSVLDRKAISIRCNAAQIERTKPSRFYPTSISVLIDGETFELSINNTLLSRLRSCHGEGAVVVDVANSKSSKLTFLEEKKA